MSKIAGKLAIFIKTAAEGEDPGAIAGALTGTGLSVGGTLATMPALAMAMRKGHPDDQSTAIELWKKNSPGLAEAGEVDDLVMDIVNKKRTKANKLISRLPQKFRSKASDVADAMFDAQQAQGEVQLSNMGPFYHPGKRKVYNVATEPHATVRLGDNFFTKGMRDMSDSPGVVGHELGHARIHKALGKAYVPITMAARKIGLLPMIGGMAGYYGYRNKDEKKAKAFALSGLGLSGLAGATVMADEATASLIGRKMLKGVTKDKSIINNSTKRLLSATGTYGAKYVLPVVAGGAIYAIDRKKRAKARAAEEAPTKTAGSDITFRSGEDKYTPSRGYHYAAQEQ